MCAKFVDFNKLPSNHPNLPRNAAVGTLPCLSQLQSLFTFDLTSLFVSAAINVDCGCFNFGYYQSFHSFLLSFLLPSSYHCSARFCSFSADESSIMNKKKEKKNLIVRSTICIKSYLPVFIKKLFSRISKYNLLSADNIMNVSHLLFSAKHTGRVHCV